jgi:hypothetical protein
MNWRVEPKKMSGLIEQNHGVVVHMILKVFLYLKSLVEYFFSFYISFIMER